MPRARGPRRERGREGGQRLDRVGDLAAEVQAGGDDGDFVSALDCHGKILKGGPELAERVLCRLARRVESRILEEGLRESDPELREARADLALRQSASDPREPGRDLESEKFEGAGVAHPATFLSRPAGAACAARGGRGSPRR
jgi:hypothetical protein